MITVIGTNGFGSYKKSILFSVPKEKAELLRQNCWEHVRDEGDRCVFKFNFVDTDRIDDETALYALKASLPSQLGPYCIPRGAPG